jgi:translation initiation factor eIF-2B subunit beta
LAGAQESAVETTLLVKYIVTNVKFETIHDLISIIKAAGRRLVEAQPKGRRNLGYSRQTRLIINIHQEHTVGNVVRRILRLIREEWSAANKVDDNQDPKTVGMISSL